MIPLSYMILGLMALSTACGAALAHGWHRRVLIEAERAEERIGSLEHELERLRRSDAASSARIATLTAQRAQLEGLLHDELRFRAEMAWALNALDEPPGPRSLSHPDMSTRSPMRERTVAIPLPRRRPADGEHGVRPAGTGASARALPPGAGISDRADCRGGVLVRPTTPSPWHRFGGP